MTPAEDEGGGGFRPIDRSQHLLLVVDDEPASLYATVRLLRQAGFRTAEAATGAAGLAAATDEVSAMVVDVHLPDMDGFELCRQLRLRPGTSRMPVLHLTAAYVTDADKVRGLDSGADAYLTRPVEPAVLIATVQALVRTRIAEDAMRHSEAKFRAIYSQAPCGIGLLDGQGRFVQVNAVLQRLLGRDEAELVGHAVAEFAPPEARAIAQDMARRDGHLLSWEFPVLDPSGHVLQLEWSVSRDIEPGLDMVVVNDISVRAALEQQRKQLLERERVARSEAERINRSKDDFIAVLSHELRTPLNAIIQWAHLLAKRGGTPEQMRGYAAIDRNVKLQGRLITDLLDISRLNTGKLPMQLEWADPAELVREAVQAMQQSFEENASPLILEIPEGQAFHAIRADTSRLQQVLWNLLTNALKFSPRGGRIWVSLAEDAQGLTLGVRDEGQGMSADFLPLAFDRFSQSPAVRRQGEGGLGLGLSIVKQLVEAHGGTIAVDSPGLGQGSSFTVRLPASSRLADEGQPADEVSGPGEFDADPAIDPMLTGLRLLIVEDDREAGSMLQLILRERGAEVALAQDFESAMTALKSGRPDVLVSDIGLPDQDGYDLIRQLRERESAAGLPRLPAIALTAFTRPQDQEQALAAGFDQHCAKPVRHLRLVQMIQQLAGRT
ncbi:response regulator [Pelomonas sp. KK5]|uniref:hybrid sensor histidine kinase/response regulator n=1 Tax=Pelomonas sp. KK5 TaxID=1855730 RepID=UPI00097BEB68|nr:response regulator [Pelomonas sp. KK5]